jgi:hypothetical protein
MAMPGSFASGVPRDAGGVPAEKTAQHTGARTALRSERSAGGERAFVARNALPHHVSGVPFRFPFAVFGRTIDVLSSN